MSTIGARSTACIENGDVWAICIAALCAIPALVVLYLLSVTALGRYGRALPPVALAAVAAWGSIVWAATDDACYLAHGAHMHPLLLLFKACVATEWAAVAALALHAAHAWRPLRLSTWDAERAPLYPEDGAEGGGKGGGMYPADEERPRAALSDAQQVPPRDLLLLPVDSESA